jgi:hypothetical protein
LLPTRANNTSGDRQPLIALADAQALFAKTMMFLEKPYKSA